MLREIISIDENRCTGCGQCIPSCAEGAITIVDGKARIMADKLCDGLGACLGSCPHQALQIITREAEAFELEEAGHHTLKSDPFTLECGCPGSASRQFAGPGAGRVGTWPLKLRLLPAQANFLRQADLLVAADCAGATSPEFHALARQKVVVMFCPKFEALSESSAKLEQILSINKVRQVVLLRMEVPCCHGLINVGEELCQKLQISYSVKIMKCSGEII